MTDFYDKSFIGKLKRVKTSLEKRAEGLDEWGVPFVVTDEGWTHKKETTPIEHKRNILYDEDQMANIFRY